MIIYCHSDWVVLDGMKVDYPHDDSSVTSGPGEKWHEILAEFGDHPSNLFFFGHIF